MITPRASLTGSMSASSTGSDAGRDHTARADEIINAVKQQTTAKKVRTKRSRSRGKEQDGRVARQGRISETSRREHTLDVWSVAYMAIVGLVTFAVSTIIGLRTKLAILEHYSSRLERGGPAKRMSVWGTALVIIAAVTLVLGLIFSFLLMESARWRQRLAVKTVLVSYPIGITNGLLFARNFCQAAGLALADCSGAAVGLFLLSFVIMILSKMLYLILKDVIGWEEIEV
ncbi:hypothetical protein KEM54_000730 [Ascosphaera aggregata]|nr:hypothetical protein KEM54_000730 [Ascosphaera aggregata]